MQPSTNVLVMSLPATPPERLITERWGLAQRVGFRFLFAYLVLYFFPLPTGLSSPEWLSGIMDGTWHRLVTWLGEAFLGLRITTFSNGSGDTTYDYLRVLCMVLIAVAAALVWSLLDRERPNYRTLHSWSRIWLRYALATCLLTYGVVKVIKLQFPTPSYTALTETYGDSSPMRLLWTFMGFSTAYTFFAGAAETLGALLLFFRRTTTLGTLVVLAVMTNVAMLNFCYDVPVKLGSLHLLLLAAVLLAPDARRLADLLLFTRTTSPGDLGPAWPRPWMRPVGRAIKVVVVGAALTSQFWGAIQARNKRPATPTPPDGWYAVSSFRENGSELPALATDGHRWKTFVLLRGYVRLWGFDRSTRVFKVEGKPGSAPFTLFPVGELNEPMPGAQPAGRLELKIVLDRKATLQGTFEGQPIVVALERLESSEFPLLKRGFHWISEFPYNR